MLKIERLGISFDRKTILKDLTFTFADQSVTALVGPSGIGKTTLIRAIAGLIPKYTGQVISSYERPAVMFQEARLFPWMNALENVNVVCKDPNKAKFFLEQLLPDRDASQKYPQELSGGMKQRVSLARALAYEPDLLLMDEPFKGLDETTRRSVSDFLFDHLKGTTVLMITHDSADLPYCDQVLRMEGTPVSQLILEKSNIGPIE